MFHILFNIIRILFEVIGIVISILFIYFQYENTIDDFIMKVMKKLTFKKRYITQNNRSRNEIWTGYSREEEQYIERLNQSILAGSNSGTMDQITHTGYSSRQIDNHIYNAPLIINREPFTEEEKSSKSKLSDEEHDQLLKLLQKLND